MYTGCARHLLNYPIATIYMYDHGYGYWLMRPIGYVYATAGLLFWYRLCPYGLGIGGIGLGDGMMRQVPIWRGIRYCYMRVCSCASPTVDLAYPGVDGGWLAPLGPYCRVLAGRGWCWCGQSLIWRYDCLGCLKCAPNGVVGWQAI